MTDLSRPQKHGQVSSPIPTLHDHGPKSLTLATVRVSNYPKPYRNPINELGLQLPTLSRSGRERSKEVGGAVLPDTPTQGSTTPTQHLPLTSLNEIHDYSTIAHKLQRAITNSKVWIKNLIIRLKVHVSFCMPTKNRGLKLFKCPIIIFSFFFYLVCN